MSASLRLSWAYWCSAMLLCHPLANAQVAVPVLIGLGDGIEPSVGADGARNILVLAMRQENGEDAPTLCYRTSSDRGGTWRLWVPLTPGKPNYDPTVAVHFDNPQAGQPRDFYLGGLPVGDLQYSRYQLDDDTLHDTQIIAERGAMETLDRPWFVAKHPNVYAAWLVQGAPPN